MIIIPLLRYLFSKDKIVKDITTDHIKSQNKQYLITGAVRQSLFQQMEASFLAIPKQMISYNECSSTILVSTHPAIKR